MINYAEHDDQSAENYVQDIENSIMRWEFLLKIMLDRIFL